MNTDRLFALYDRVADAPDAVGRLRRFVLDLAVRGKLVEQDPGDEPARGLSQRIMVEKARLVRAGEIRQPKRFEVATDSSYDLPTSWCLVALGDVVVKHLGGGTPSKSNGSYWNGAVRWASVKDVGKSKYLDDTIDRITEAGLQNSSSNLIEPGNLLVVTRMGLGKVSINRVSVAINQDLRALILSDLISVDYAYNFFLTHGFEGTGLTVKGIKLKELLSIPFPLPPLAEQRRIVAKVDELMALCDRLEEARTAREDTRDRLTKASLACLSAADTDVPTFRSHARFAVDALPALTSRPDLVKHLRQTILNLAVRGRLVEQDWEEDRGNQGQLRSDAVAETFDARAFEGRAALFNIPVNWAIEPLSRVASHIVDCLHTTPKWTDDGVLCIKTNQVRAGQLDLSSPHFVSENTYKVRVNRLEPRQDDVLYIREGGILGVACLVPSNTRLCLGQRLMHIRTNNAVVPQFLELCLNSPWITEFAIEKTTGGAAPRVNMSIVRGYPIPLPPLAEQHRIVAEIDALMALCDRMGAGLAAADATRSRLLESLLHAALASAASRTLSMDRPFSSRHPSVRGGLSRLAHSDRIDE